MGRFRSSVPRSRLPLHRRPFADPAALRRWLLVAVLAATTTALTGHLLSAAESARTRWGETRRVLVTAEPVAAGAPVAGALRSVTWPVALVPPDAVGRVPAGARAVAPLDPGVPLTRSLVAAPNAGLADRQRVALLPGSAPLPLSVGDRVDVWATTDPSLGEGGLATDRIAARAVVTSADEHAVVVAVTVDEVPDVAEAAALATVTVVGLDPAARPDPP